MFSKTDGPTALRTDLVRGLSFSLDRIERRSGAATVSSLASLAGVWNGRKGYVALLVRDVDPACVERFVGDAPITSEAELDAAVEEGLAFAESLGFSMDEAEFLTLSSEAREARIHRWNKLRKVRGAPAKTPAETAPSLAPMLDIPELPPIPTGYEIELDELSVPAPPPTPEFSGDLFEGVPAEDAELESASQVENARSTVLGRISLVRKSGADGRRLELIARLLAFF